MRPVPLMLEDAFKQFRHDQDKIITPEETVDRFRERLARSGLDILDDVVRIDNGRLNIPVYFSVCGPEARATIGNYKQMGKGATPAQSMASAVMELGERFSLFSFYRNPENFVTATAAEITEPKMEFAQIAQSVEDDSEDLDVAAKFFETLPLKWTWAHNLTTGEGVMVPFNWFWTINEFNGSSAGNCNEEALCQGICEVVERHVCSLISRNRINAPLIDIDSVNDPVAIELIDKYRSNGVELILSDFTQDMGIPSVGALAWDPKTFPHKSEIVWTAGTTPSATKALCRALTEVAQLAGDFNSNANYVASGLPKFQSLEAADYVIHPGRSVALNELPELGDNNIKLEVERCIAALASRDMDVLVVDVRHPLLDVPAFYTIIPGTQFRERAAHSSVGMMIAKIIAGNFAPSQAIARLKEFDAALPGKYFLQFYLGQIYLDRGNHQDALDYFSKALAFEPPAEDLASVYTYMGLCYKELSQFDKAKTVLNKGHRTDPERTDTLNLLGFSHFKLGDHEQAIACFKKLIALDPSSAIDYANIAANYRAMGKKAKAIEFYQLALALDESIDFAKEHLAQLGIKA
ncbi:MAG: YcaO-like family protein [Desulfobacteraceae bacterium]|jgi:ribosomal protein S12 methylthiotransferase accessory factor